MVEGIDTDARSCRYYRNAVERGWDPAAIDLVSYAAEKRAERMRQIADAAADLPDLAALTRIEE